MSASRGVSKQHSLPANPQYISFTKSDGDSKKWPTDTVRKVDHEGYVNYQDPVGLEDPIAIKWRCQVGAACAKSDPVRWPGEPTSYVLKDWPSGYAFYIHNKGKEAAPRQDVYLFGGPSRFRSVPEFIPHAIWLLQDPTEDRDCPCKYCSKTAQRDITKALSDIMPSQSPAPARGTPRPIRTKPYLPKKSKEKQKVYTAVQRVPKPFPKPAGPQLSPMVRERNADIRAVSGQPKESMELRRWFRHHELVWCSISRPILGPNGEHDGISYWPCIVEDVWTKADPLPKQAANSDEDPFQSEPINDAQNGSDSGEARKEATGSSLWNVKQYTEYTMRMLPGSFQIRVNDYFVLPYQAHAPPTALIDALKSFPTEKLNFDPDVVAAFNPCPSDDLPPPLFEAAAAPYAVAIQIGAKLSGFWSLTDEYDFKFTVQPRPAPPTSLSAAITAAGSKNAIDEADPADLEHLAKDHYRGISGPVPNMSPTELQQLAHLTLGNPPTTHNITQIRYQGLWWGAERIWCDDFVRLKVRRACLAPQGAAHILAPSGPGKAMQEKWKTVGKENLAQMGAATRGVFMRLDGLFIVDAPQPDGAMKKECRASGMLYELADEDWEEPSEAPQINGQAPEPTTPKATHFASNGLLGPPEVNSATQANADPAVPVPPTGQLVDGQTAASSSSMPPPPAPKKDLNTSALHYPLPEPPAGYKWRAILEPGHETVMSLSLLSGRYYPGILSHPLLAPALMRATSNALEDGGLMEYAYLWALEGLSPGYFNSVDPVRAKANRSSMVLDAHTDARADLEAMLQARLEEENMQKMEEPDGHIDQLAMDVDS